MRLPISAFRRGHRLLLGILVLATGPAATAQDDTAPTRAAGVSTSTAFVNVNLIRMDSDRVQAGQTVLVRDGRIAFVGPSATTRVPEDTTIIDASGRYLLPGLTDAHVHLSTDMPWARVRLDFRDAPLYLAHGVTTVINLRGTPEQLEWRRRIEAGDLLGPTIYTSGEFINEPRVTSPAEVEAEIAAQRRAGYDLVKFHEIWTPADGYVTTDGLPAAAYRAMNRVAHQTETPLVGHAPVNLGLDALLEGRQALAHVGMLSNIYFLPVPSGPAWLVVTASAFVALTILMAAAGAATIARRWRRLARPAPVVSRIRVLCAVSWAASLFGGVSAFFCLPVGPLFDSVLLRVAFTCLVVITALVSATALVLITTSGRDPALPAFSRWHAMLTVFASCTVAAAGLLFWLPVAWRSSDYGIDRLARRIHDAGIVVQTTLVNYDAVGGLGRLRLLNDPAIDYLHPDTRARWRQRPQTGPPGYRYTAFLRKVVGALHRAGVPLMSGTDAMGVPLVAPGSSLHYELQLLVASGLTPFEAIRTATVVPARFLRKEADFGTVIEGGRADLVLVQGNPLQDITRLRSPEGVMVRGKWLTRRELEEMLAPLREEQRSSNPRRR